ncbi:MAG: hypothetical protein COV66_05195 [Nitrospinae bacterium CG11_big_fil_rev_8_21_14_0_20_45_15]|nr:MAG: hypothetical protein COV66_05195 [Nitrospinae bacterium CG11_big_fil_rev_8_21_14_0_20_45_15]
MTESILSKSQLEDTRQFWNANPCDGQANISQRMEFRYKKDTWLPEVFSDIGKQYTNVLEVGCGQGSDALYCCQHMRKGSSYTGIDYSEESLQSAQSSVKEIANNLEVIPQFLKGNAENLEFPDNSYECVVSIGVLHHTPNTQEAINEIHRVLEKGGVCYIALYRIYSPKVLAAYLLRILVSLVDAIGGKNFVLGRVRKFGSNHSLGTMLLEGIGVPIMSSYTLSQIKKMFKNFEIIEVQSKGLGLPFFNSINKWFDKGSNPLGLFWFIKAKKSE